MDLENLLKTILKRKYKNRNGAHPENSLLPARVCIPEPDRNNSDMRQHEFRFIDKSELPLLPECETLSISDILSCDCKHNSSKRIILTTGVCGIGKTTTVESFALEWADGRGYHDIDLLFPLTFWELNLLKRKLSFIELLHTFYPELEQLNISSLKERKVWFVLDGLDECHLALNFNSRPVSDASEVSRLDCVVTSLIRGKLLPNAHLWITTRPATARRIPVDLLLKVTEIQGFSDEQKEQHFRTIIGNEDLAIKAMNHVKISRSLDFLCQIPQICSIMACVLKNHVLKADGEFKINPLNLTQIYTNLVNTQVTKSDKAIIVKLEKLALNRLGEHSLVMYDPDLNEAGISGMEASEYSKRYPLVWKQERGLHNTVIYRFSHYSIQEYFAASSALSNIESKGDSSLDETVVFFSCQILVNKAVDSAEGYVDGFLRFVFGLLKEQGRMKPSNPLVDYTKNRILDNILCNSSVSLLHCLREFDSRAFLNEVQSFLQTGVAPVSDFTTMHWAFLAQRIQSFEGVLDVFELNLPSRCDESIARKLPAILKSKKAMLSFCNLTEKCCPALAEVLSRKDSNLKELDLGCNSIRDSGVKKLMKGLIDQDCKLKTLRLQCCGLTSHACIDLASILSQSPKLGELDLSGNEIGDHGLLHLAKGIQSPGCRLDTLKLSHCGIKEKGCCSLASALEKNSHHLKELDLSINTIGDKAANELFKKADISQLTKLQMYHCNLTALSCGNICTALESETGTLVELNLSHNDLKDSGFQLICKGMHAWSSLQKLNLSRCGITGQGCSYLAQVLWSISQLYGENFVRPSAWQAIILRDLDLSMNCLGDRGAKAVVSGLKNPYGHVRTLNLSCCGLTDKCCADLASSFASEDSIITEVDLSNNDLHDKGVKRLCVGLGNPHCKLEKLGLRNCGLSSASIQCLISALKSNPRHLEELHLMGNSLEDSGIRVLMDLTQNKKYNLQTIDVTTD